MPHTPFPFIPAALFAAAIAATSCSDESGSSDYQSAPPTITAIDISALDGGAVQAGKPLVATIVQNPIGRLLYQATYDWTLSPSADYMKHSNGAIYDNEPANPTDTFAVTTPGTYTITFTAKYKISGSNHQIWNGTTAIPSGSVAYTTSALSYDVVATREITIR